MYDIEEGRKLYYMYVNINKVLLSKIRGCTDLVELNHLIKEHSANQVHINSLRWYTLYRIRRD